jgi:hypothetical protein
MVAVKGRILKQPSRFSAVILRNMNGIKQHILAMLLYMVKGLS